MTKEMMRLLIEAPELLNRMSLPELFAYSSCGIKDIPEPRLLIPSPLDPDGTPLAIVFPVDDYRELCDVFRRVYDALSGIEGTVSALRKHVMTKDSDSAVEVQPEGEKP